MKDNNARSERPTQSSLTRLLTCTLVILSGLPRMISCFGAQQINPAVCGEIVHVNVPSDPLDHCLSVCTSPDDGPGCIATDTTCCPPGGSDSGGCCDAGVGSSGMPGWVVSEPSVHLRLNDTPLWYRPSRGRDVRF